MLVDAVPPIPPERPHHVPSARARPLAGITLIPGEFRTAVALGWERFVALVGIVLSLAVIGSAWAFLRVRVATEERAAGGAEAQVQALVERLETTREELRTSEALLRRATIATSLLSEHTTWTSFFRLLEERTLPAVTYENLTADMNGSIVLPASAPDIRSAAEQVVAWRSASGVRAVESSGITVIVDEVGVSRGARFDLRLTVDPTMFRPAPSRAGNGRP